MIRKDCFAFKKGKCSCTTQGDCSGCAFYKPKEEQEKQHRTAHKRAKQKGHYTFYDKYQQPNN